MASPVDGERRLLKRARLRRVFEEVDRNGNNELDRDELLSAFILVSDPELSNIGEDEVAWVLSAFDRDDSATLSFEEFLVMFDRVKLKVIFESIDTDGSGSISSSELQGALQRLGFDPDKDTVDAMVARVDVSRNSLVEFDEFVSFFAELDELSLESLTSHLYSALSVPLGNDFVPDLPPAYVSYWKFLTAGASSGVVSKTLTAPLERVKLIQQSRAASVSFLSVARSIVADAGAAGLLRGNMANVAQAVPFAGIVCVMYSQLCRAQPDREGVDPAHPWPAWHMASGAVAATTATVLTYPLDVIRSHMSVQLKSSGEVYDKSMAASASRLVKKGGVRALYRGLATTLGSIAPFVGIQLTTYDVLKVHLPPLIPGIDDAHQSVPFSAACGAVAGATALTATFPVDVVRRRLQLGNAHYTSFVQGARHVLATQGVAGFFRGWGAAAAKVAPTVASGLVVRDTVLSIINPST